MVRAELSLESVRRAVQRRISHDARVAHQHIERLAPGQEVLGACAHAIERVEVQLQQFHPARLQDALQSLLALVQVSRRAEDLGARLGQRSGRLDTDA